MGKNLRQQRRGRGTPRYRSPSHRFLGKVGYNFLPENVSEGTITNIVDAPGRQAPVAVVKFGEKKFLHIAAEGMYVGQKIGFEGAETGNIVKLGKVPDGTKIYNVEALPGDGGKICRSSGTFATVISREGEKCVILLPSSKKKILSEKCMASVGSVAGAGRLEKPFMKAGTRFHSMHAFGRMYPRTSGVAMNPVDHPFGGKTKPGKHKTVSKHMPPGKKVGSISPRRTGKKKRA